MMENERANEKHARQTTKNIRLGQGSISKWKKERLTRAATGYPILFEQQSLYTLNYNYPCHSVHLLIVNLCSVSSLSSKARKGREEKKVIITGTMIPMSRTHAATDHQHFDLVWNVILAKTVKQESERETESFRCRLLWIIIALKWNPITGWLLVALKISMIITRTGRVRKLLDDNRCEQISMGIVRTWAFALSDC